MTLMTSQLSDVRVRMRSLRRNFPSSFFRVPSSERSSELGSLNSEIYENSSKQIKWTNLNFLIKLITVARYGHAADLFFTRRAHVNHVHVRTSSSTCAYEVLRANVKFRTRWLRWNHFQDGRGFKKISSREPRIEGRRVAGQIICRKGYVFTHELNEHDSGTPPLPDCGLM